MLERETTYRLAGRKHRARGLASEPEVLRKRREIRFHFLPLDQAERALPRLSGVPDLVVERSLRGRAVWVTYSLEHHTLEGIEGLLVEMGFHLDGSLYTRLLRALIRYCEETQLRNLRSPERLIKQSSEVYVQAWTHHPHGDHDDTPLDLREYK